MIYEFCPNCGREYDEIDIDYQICHRCGFNAAKIVKKWECLICHKPVPEYKPKYCCNGVDCGCMGQPIEPCVCSDTCYEAVMKGIGKSFEERRKDAGIALYS